MKALCRQIPFLEQMVIGEPIACACDSLVVSGFAALVGTSVVVQKLEESINSPFSIDCFLCLCQFREPFVHLIYNLILELVKPVKDIANIVQALSLCAILNHDFGFFNCQQQFIPSIPLERVADCALNRVEL